MSLSKYIPKNIKPMSTINRITYRCEACIVAMLLQLDLNKCWLTQLKKIDRLYINAAPTRLLQISKIYYIEYKYQTFLKIHTWSYNMTILLTVILLWILMKLYLLLSMIIFGGTGWFPWTTIAFYIVFGRVLRLKMYKHTRFFSIIIFWGKYVMY